MRKLIIAALAALVIGSTLTLAPPSLAGAKKAGAQAGHQGGKRLAKMADTLGLTDAQKAQLKPMLADAAKQTRAVRQNKSLTPEAQKAQLKAIRKTTKQKIASVLTPEQKAKLAAMRHHGKKHGAKGAPAV
ncbi:MAG: hypothetical protein M3Y28_02225 [Armatimonadota bacterium]|nr:hypothetical protein [Armatimonadota bacterium]